ncbi:MAG TPA: helix-turn-helix transcriptional regulator [Dongiaceae bacterium]|jgi:transcriptional regulator with XRE-family HTH domain|nr:helix-turn-helix transcriptional regulator [Dongiaceae bacterium]
MGKPVNLSNTRPPAHLMPIYARVGRRLNLRRKAQGLSRDELARQLKVTAQKIEAYESGTIAVPADHIHRIARLLEVPITFLFEPDSD